MKKLFLALGIGAIALAAIFIWQLQRPESAEKKLEIVSGSVQVIDTATLNVVGRTISLAGLEPVTMPEAVEAAKGYFTQVGAVACQAADTGWVCKAIQGNKDVAEVLAFSGLAMAAKTARPSLIDAQNDARLARRGYWSTVAE